jgi:ABC-2 type transport system ATP-binding protein
VKSATLLRQQEGVAALRVEAAPGEGSAPPPELAPAVARAVVGAGLDLLRIERGAPQLESIFLRLTQGKAQA